jgi:hypothetical protein
MSLTITATNRTYNIQNQAPNSIDIDVYTRNDNLITVVGQYAVVGRQGYAQTVVGNYAATNSIGECNTFVGAQAANANESGKANTYVGAFAGLSNNGNFNTFLGANVATNARNISENVYVGFSAGQQNNGNQNVFIGTRNSSRVTSVANSVSIGNNSYTSSTSTVGVGNNITQTTGQSIVVGNNSKNTNVDGILLGNNIINGGCNVIILYPSATPESNYINNENDFINIGGKLTMYTGANSQKPTTIAGSIVIIGNNSNNIAISQSNVVINSKDFSAISSNNIQLLASNNIGLSNASNTSFYLAGNNISGYAPSNLTLVGQSNASIASGGDTYISASNMISLSNNFGYVSLSPVDLELFHKSNITITANSYVDIGSSNDIQVFTSCNVISMDSNGITVGLLNDRVGFTMQSNIGTTFVGNVNLCNQLNVSGDSFYSGTANFCNINVLGVAVLCNVVLNSSTFEGDLFVKGRIFACNDVFFNSQLNVTGATQLQSNLDVLGLTNLCNLTVSGDGLFGSNVRINGGAYLNNTLDVASNAVLRGDLSVSSNITVFGEAAFSNTITVTSNATFFGNTSFAKNVYIDSNLIANVIEANILQSYNSYSSNSFVSQLSVSNLRINGQDGIQTYSNYIVDLIGSNLSAYCNYFIDIVKSIGGGGIPWNGSNYVPHGGLCPALLDSNYSTIEESLIIHGHLHVDGFICSASAITVNSNFMVLGGATFSNNATFLGNASFANTVYIDSNLIANYLYSSNGYISQLLADVGSFSNLNASNLRINGQDGIQTYSNYIVDLIGSNLSAYCNYFIDIAKSIGGGSGGSIWNGSNYVPHGGLCPALLDSNYSTIEESLIIHGHLHVDGFICSACNITVNSNVYVGGAITTQLVTTNNIKLGVDDPWWTIYIDTTSNNRILKFESKNGNLISFDDEFMPETLNFTGKHRCVGALTKENVGQIVVTTGEYMNLENTHEILIDEAIPIVKLCTKENDKAVFGVLGGIEDNNYFKIGYMGFFHKNIMNRAVVQNVGEGGIWVCNINGNLENGDYITTSSIPGLGMKQDSPCNYNYTVSKITCDCHFDFKSKIYKCKVFKYKGITYKKAFVGCIYVC